MGAEPPIVDATSAPLDLLSEKERAGQKGAEVV